MSQVRSVLDIPIFQKTNDLYKMLHGYHQRIPKFERYTIWQKCEQTTLAMVEFLIETSSKTGEERTRVIHLFSNKLELLKVLIRLANDTRTINTAQYAAIQLMINEIGRMTGGWIKFVSQ